MLDGVHDLDCRFDELIREAQSDPIYHCLNKKKCHFSFILKPNYVFYVLSKLYLDPSS